MLCVIFILRWWVNMDISKINQNFSDAVKEVEKTGMMTVEKYGKPAYVFMTYEFFRNIQTFCTSLGSQPIDEKDDEPGITLHEAMCIVLREQPNRSMRYNELANTIWDRGLYRKRNGEQAASGQIMLRARNYPHLFAIGGEYNHDIILK